MRIANNISAMNTHRTLINSDNQMSKSMERLSSGYRINKAADDAAGLAISEKMRAQVKGLNQASRNAQDGISMIQTAEGGLNEMHSILQRMRELAVQAGNDTLTASDKDEIQKEITQLVSEVDRISSDTEFNTKKLLNGSAGVAATAQNTNVTGAGVTKGGVGVIDGDNINSVVTLKAGNETETGVYNVSVSQTATAAQLGGAAASVAALSGGNAGTLTVNGTAVELEAGDSLNDIVTKINNVTNQTGVEAENDGGDLILSSEALGSDVTISVQGSNTLLSDLGLTTGTETALTDAGEDAIATFEGSTMLAEGNVLTDSTTGIEINLDDSLVVATGSTLAFNAAVDPNGQVALQIGANSNQTITFSISNMDTSSLGIDDLDVTTDAAAALDKIDDALESVSSERSKLGAYQNRLEHTISNLGVSAENISASESRVRDVDMAAEMTQFTKNQILSQAATSMLAQANQKSQSVLKLLG